MLRVRVFMQRVNGTGDQTMVWEGPLQTRHEDRTLQEYRELSWDTRLFGEQLGMRFKDGSGGGCQVEGSFMGAEITTIAGGHQIDLTFAGDKYRVW